MRSVKMSYIGINIPIFSLFTGVNDNFFMLGIVTLCVFKEYVYRNYATSVILYMWMKKINHLSDNGKQYVCHSPIKFYWNPALICFLSKYFSKNLSGIMLFFNVEFTIAVTIKFMSELLLLEGFGSESCMALNINRNLQDISMLILSYPDWIIWMFESFEVILWSVFNSKSSNTH